VVRRVPPPHESFSSADWHELGHVKIPLPFIGFQVGFFWFLYQVSIFLKNNIDNLHQTDKTNDKKRSRTSKLILAAKTRIEFQKVNPQKCF